MRSHSAYTAIFALFIMFFQSFPLSASRSIMLVPPQRRGGLPLMEALVKRASTKSFQDKELSHKTLSGLLWAAFGINRPKEMLRTAPSAMNSQEMDIYVMLKTGIYLYRHRMHKLEEIARGDHRKLAGTQEYAQKAPVNLFFVADKSRLHEKLDPKRSDLYIGSHAGFIGQNVYLFCASEGLGAVIRDSMDRPALRELMQLTDNQVIVLAQTVGYPAD